MKAAILLLTLSHAFTWAMFAGGLPALGILGAGFTGGCILFLVALLLTR